MKNKKIIIVLVLIIVLQNVGLFIKSQNIIKQMVRNTESYINGTIASIGDLIDLEINENSAPEDIDNLDKNASLIQYYMQLAQGSLDGYRMNININLETMYNYIREHQEILEQMISDDMLQVEEKEFLRLLKDELYNYSADLNKLENKLFISVKEVNACAVKIDTLTYQVQPQAFGYLQRYNEFISK